jgi:cilia- and flagella-associated protein 57
MTSIGFSNPQGFPTFQVSFNPFDANAVVVTGPSTYKYYKIGETEFTVDHS